MDPPCAGWRERVAARNLLLARGHALTLAFLKQIIKTSDQDSAPVLTAAAAVVANITCDNTRASRRAGYVITISDGLGLDPGRAAGRLQAACLHSVSILASRFWTNSLTGVQAARPAASPPRRPPISWRSDRRCHKRVGMPAKHDAGLLGNRASLSRKRRPAGGRGHARAAPACYRAARHRPACAAAGLKEEGSIPLLHPL